MNGERMGSFPARGGESLTGVPAAAPGGRLEAVARRVFALLGLAVCGLSGPAAASEAVDVIERADDPAFHLLTAGIAGEAASFGIDGYYGLGVQIAWESRSRGGFYLRFAGRGGGSPGMDGGYGGYTIAVAVPLRVESTEVSGTVVHGSGFVTRSFRTPLPRRRVLGLLLGHGGLIRRYRPDIPVLFHPEFRAGIVFRRETWGRVRYRYHDEEFGRWSFAGQRIAGTVRFGTQHAWIGGGVEAAAQWAGIGGGLQFGLDFEIGGYPSGKRTEPLFTPVADPSTYMLPEGSQNASVARVRVGFGATIGVQLAAFPPRRAGWK
jgi:hypothetical protein